LSFGALTVNGRRQVRYNVRKLSELPYHLIESGMDAELRKHVLFNYHWLHSKLAATSLPDLLADFHMATTAFDDDDKVGLLLQYSDVVISRHDIADEPVPSKIGQMFGN